MVVAAGKSDLVHLIVFWRDFSFRIRKNTTSTAGSSRTPGDSQKTQQRQPYLTPKGGVLVANDPENERKKMRKAP